MTIQEAVKSGRPFRRPGWQDYIVQPNSSDASLKWTNDNGDFCPRAEDITANDYELQPVEPRVMWIAEYEDDRGGRWLSGTYSTDNIPPKAITYMPNSTFKRLVKFEEVV